MHCELGTYNLALLTWSSSLTIRSPSRTGQLMMLEQLFVQQRPSYRVSFRVEFLITNALQSRKLHFSSLFKIRPAQLYCCRIPSDSELRATRSLEFEILSPKRFASCKLLFCKQFRSFQFTRNSVFSRSQSHRKRRRSIEPSRDSLPVRNPTHFHGD